MWRKNVDQLEVYELVDSVLSLTVYYVSASVLEIVT